MFDTPRGWLKRIQASPFHGHIDNPKKALQLLRYRFLLEEKRVQKTDKKGKKRRQRYYKIKAPRNTGKKILMGLKPMIGEICNQWGNAYDGLIQMWAQEIEDIVEKQCERQQPSISDSILYQHDPVEKTKAILNLHQIPLPF